MQHKAQTRAQPTGPAAQGAVERGLARAVKIIDPNVVLQAAAHSCIGVDHADTQVLQQLGWPNARELQQLGRVDGSTRQQHLAQGLRSQHLALVTVFDPRCPLALEQNALHQGLGTHSQVGAPQGRAQKGIGSRIAQAVSGVDRIGAHPLRLLAIKVGACRQSELLRCGQKMSLDRMVFRRPL